MNKCCEKCFYWYHRWNETPEADLLKIYACSNFDCPCHAPQKTEFPSGLGMLITDIVLNKEVGWSQELERILAQDRTEAQKEERERIRKMILVYFPEWPEPQEGAGVELGPLAGTGMYIQYDQDRKKRREEIAKFLEALEDKQIKFNDISSIDENAISPETEKKFYKKVFKTKNR